MPKDEWGVKRLCPHCNSRFYDLQRDPMTCPECGHSFTAESLVAGRGRTLIAELVKARVVWMGAAGTRLEGMEPFEGTEGTQYRAMEWQQIY